MMRDVRVGERERAHERNQEHEGMSKCGSERQEERESEGRE